MTSDDREAFLSHLKSFPRDQVVRLAYADWLSDRGEYEEENRQRHWLKADDWLREFLAEHHIGEDNREYDEETDERIGEYTGRTAADDYDRVIESIATKGYYTQYGGMSLQDSMEGPALREFCHNFEIVTGVKLGTEDDEYYGGPFSCSC